ncbi:MAG: carboxypeptidase-like regulatory domain-containing protein [Vicinamibacterales bacterium]
MRSLNRLVFVTLLVAMVTVTGRAAGVVLLGTIVDPAGAPLSGAAVELIGNGRTVAKSVTAADGSFKFSDLAAGSYEIHVRLAGFRQIRATVAIGTAAPRSLRLILPIGSVSETVSVATESPAAGTLGSARGVVPAPPRAAASPMAGQAMGGVASGGFAGVYDRGATPKPTPRPTRTGFAPSSISRCPPSRSTSTPHRTRTCAAFSTKDAFLPPTPSASRS